MVLTRMEGQIPQESLEMMRPLKLGLKVLDIGMEKALARKPEEMRRVVKLLLKKSMNSCNNQKQNILSLRRGKKIKRVRKN